MKEKKLKVVKGLEKLQNQGGPTKDLAHRPIQTKKRGKV